MMWQDIIDDAKEEGRQVMIKLLRNMLSPLGTLRDEIIQQVDEVIQGTNVTFSRFVIEATRVALENMKEDGEDGE